MNQRTRIVALILFILTASQFFGIAVSKPKVVYAYSKTNSARSLLWYKKSLVLDDAFWVYAVTEVNISGINIPAGTTAFIVILKNEGEYLIENVTIDFEAIKKIGECNETTKYYNDTVPPNYSLAFAFRISLFDNASLSEYDLPMEVKYYSLGSEVKYTLIVPVAVTGYPLIKIHAAPLYISDEGIYNYTVIVRNIGTAPARHVTVALIGYPPYVSVVSDDWYDIGILKAGENETVTFQLYITELPVSSILFVVNATFMDQRTNQIYSVAEAVPVISTEKPHIVLVASSYTPTTVFPGDKFVRVIITLANPTSKFLEDVNIELILPEEIEESYVGSTKFSIGTMMPGSYTQVTFYINVREEASPGMYNLGLNATFRGGYNFFAIPILVKEKARFKVVSIDPQILRIGARGVNLKITMKNVARVDAEGVYLQLMGGTIIKGEVITYIGKVSANEEFTVTFSIDIAENAPTGYATLDLKVSWTQEDRVLSDIYKIRVYLSPRLASSFALTIGVLSLLSIILLIPIVRTYILKRWKVEEG